MSNKKYQLGPFMEIAQYYVSYTITELLTLYKFIEKKNVSQRKEVYIESDT